jgi:hypothetical protein
VMRADGIAQWTRYGRGTPCTPLETARRLKMSQRFFKSVGGHEMDDLSKIWASWTGAWTDKEKKGLANIIIFSRYWAGVKLNNLTIA